MKGLNNIATRLHQSAISKGFWQEKREIGTLLMLVVSELAEALEADRKNRFANLAVLENCLNADDIKEEDKELYFISEFQRNIKDTFEDEIADTLIRLFDLCGEYTPYLPQKVRNKATTPEKQILVPIK